MRRFWITCFLVLALAASASAEIACDCTANVCECFIQLGDEGIAVKGIVALLADQGYLPSDRGSTYDEEVQEAVLAFQAIHGLDETGVMDDETLTLLIWGMDGAPEDAEQVVVYVPTDGGKKYHNYENCSDMYDPRMMSICNAEALGIDACHAVVGEVCEKWDIWLGSSGKGSQ